MGFLIPPCYLEVSIGDTQEHPLGVYLEKNHCISILLKLNAIFFYLIDYSIPICRLLLYSLSVLISVTMSLPEERPSFKDPSSPIGRVQSDLAALFLFDSVNNVQANLPNNNINKGRWTEEEHKIFMQEYEKYGNNCMQIAKVLSTRTPAQI